MVTVYRTVLWLLLTGLCYGYCLQDCAMVTASKTVLWLLLPGLLWLLFTGLCYGYCFQDCAMVNAYRTVIHLLLSFLSSFLSQIPLSWICHLYLSLFDSILCVINLFFSFHFVPCGRVEIGAFPFLGRVITQWLKRRRSRVRVPAGAARECSSLPGQFCVLTLISLSVPTPSYRSST